MLEDQDQWLGMKKSAVTLCATQLDEFYRETYSVALKGIGGEQSGAFLPLVGKDC